jgi:BMFP domain-containing protein YqiC
MIMPKTNFLKDLAAQLTAAIPSHVITLKKDFEKNCHSILTKTFQKLDIVTREEFATQTKVLNRTRKKLEELEEQLKKIEKSLKAKHDKPL